MMLLLNKSAVRDANRTFILQEKSPIIIYQNVMVRLVVMHYNKS